jgi:hypothetical protein
MAQGVTALNGEMLRATGKVQINGQEYSKLLQILVQKFCCLLWLNV